MMQGILDLLLHVLTTPQSAVVHLRAVGGAIHALEQFGVSMFLEIAGENLQHWIRIMLSLMNSISLSVRSIAVDFVVSLLASVYRSNGSIEAITLVLLTVLPEVVAREVALCSVSGLVSSFEHVETSVWPLRRAFADVEDANPLDDDRVEPDLVPLLSVFCRACQAVIDGVFIELRMDGEKCSVVGSSISIPTNQHFLFDADEESLMEAANVFDPENGPFQRIRWLYILKSLHEAKGQWLEAAEALFLCAKTACNSIMFLSHVWRPSRFALWSDSRRSQWLSTVGEDLGHPNRGNLQVMEFAANFLEPSFLLGVSFTPSPGDRIAQPTVSDVCAVIGACVHGMLANAALEKDVGSFAHARLKALLDLVTQTIDECNNSNLPFNHYSHLEAPDKEALRQLCADLNQEVAKLSQRVTPTTTDPHLGSTDATTATEDTYSKHLFFVCLLLTGRKAPRFLESTTVPTFLEWDKPCICRVPTAMVARVAASGLNNTKDIEDRICREFALPLGLALAKECGEENVVIRIGSTMKGIPQGDALATETFLNVSIVHAVQGDESRDDCTLESQRFLLPKPQLDVFAVDPGEHKTDAEPVGDNEEFFVANKFPSALSRQRLLVTDSDSTEAETLVAMY